MNDQEDPTLHRGMKIYSILSDRNRDESNVHHLDLEFGDDSVKFVPKVLGCVNRYSESRRDVAVPPLSVMYEILRSWRVPELFESH